MNVALVTGSCGLVGSESSIFFSKKGFKIIGIDNNSRKSFFGKDGDITWVKKKLKKELKSYTHYNSDIRNSGKGYGDIPVFSIFYTVNIIDCYIFF